jgi:hypothetical protein
MKHHVDTQSALANLATAISPEDNIVALLGKLGDRQ